MIEIQIEAEGVLHGVSDVLLNAADAALKHMGIDGDITILLADDEGMRGLNRAYRGIDHATDVLSFPFNEGEALLGFPGNYIGDIAISYPKARAQAEQYNHSLERELSFLTIHGVLHILGYDHGHDESEGDMFSLQEEILESAGLKR